MSWRVAQSLLTLRDQVNAKWPNRKKDSDGTIAGDQHHQANPGSDHEPHVMDGKVGIVTALDITNDPATGPVSNDLAEILRLSKDPRIKYLISNRRICSSKIQPWVWRPYNGANPHDHHMHISVMPDKSLYDSTAAWAIDNQGAENATASN